MRLQKVYFIFLMFFLILTSCRSYKHQNNNNSENKTHGRKTMTNLPRPLPIVYKTKADYYPNVAITLSEDKTTIVSYPDINDVYYDGKLAYPTRLINGYLLDNRGIDKNSAFIKYTYDQYSKLSATPSPESIFELIIDNDPFLEMYRLECDRDTAEINRIIAGGFTEKSQKLK